MLAIVLMIAALAACDETLGPTGQLDREFVLAPGESLTVENLSVRFLRVVDDTRCPADANCVWQGDAHVLIAATLEGVTREHGLHTSDGKPVARDGYTIHLVRLQPYPFSARTIQPEEYRVTLRVERQ